MYLRCGRIGDHSVDMTGVTASATRITRSEGRIVIAAAVALAGLYATLAWRMPLHGVWHDDGLYIGLGRSLAGGSYRIEQLPGAPEQSKYPPLHPAVIAAIVLAAGRLEGSEWIFALPGAAFAAAAAGLWYAVLRRRLAPGPAAAACVLAATAPGTLVTTGCAMSEPLATMLFAACLWILDGPGARRRAAVAGFLFGLCGLTRAVFVPLLPVLAWAAARRSGRAAGLRFLLAGIAVLAPWIAWIRTAPRTDLELFRYYLDYGGVFSRHVDELFLTRLADIGLGTAGQILGAVHLPEVEERLGSAAADAADVAGTILGLAGLAAVFLRPRRTGPAVRAALAATAVICLPTWWATWRYLLPVLPASLTGLIALLEACGIRRRAPAVLVAVGLAFNLPVAVLQLQIRPDTECRMWSWSYPVAHLRETADAIRRLTPEDAVLAVNMDPWFHLETGRRCVMVAPPAPMLAEHPELWDAWSETYGVSVLEGWAAAGVTHLVTHPWNDPWIVPVFHHLDATGSGEELWRGRLPAYRILRLDLEHAISGR